jgi:hypothetical protein
MWKGKGPFRLVLNSKAGKEIEWHVKVVLNNSALYRQRFNETLQVCCGNGCRYWHAVEKPTCYLF